MSRTRSLGPKDPCRFLLLTGLCTIILPAACSKERDNPWDPHGINPRQRDIAIADRIRISDQLIPDKVHLDRSLSDQSLPDQALPDKAVPDMLLPDGPSVTNGNCSTPKQISLVGGHAQVNGNTSNSINEFGKKIICGAVSTFDGPQLYYSIQLNLNKNYTITVKPLTSWDPALYVFPNAGCTAAKINSGCVGKVADNGTNGMVEIVSFHSGTGGAYYLVVDSYAPSQMGTFKLTADEMSPDMGVADQAVLDATQTDLLLSDSSKSDHGSLSSCQSLFGKIDGYQLCLEKADRCTFYRSYWWWVSCNDICGSYKCLSAGSNDPFKNCTWTPIACNSPQLDAVCTCRKY